MTRVYQGIWPVAPTPFTDTGEIDADGMRRVLDFMIDAGVDGICILANYSEQFLLSDAEREMLTRLSIEHVAGRVPVIVTISHYATRIAVERARFAKALQADAVMIMPPYHGATLRGNEQQTTAQFAAVGEAGIPIMIQDAPLSGVELSAASLARMATDIEMVKLVKIECVRAADKLRLLLELGGAAIEGPFDGEEGITLMADLDAGATGTMTSAMMPDLIKPVVTHHLDGNRAAAAAAYANVLPVINYENRQCGWLATKAAMVAGGVIKTDYCRHPVTSLNSESRAGLLELLQAHDPLVLRWGT